MATFLYVIDDEYIELYKCKYVIRTVANAMKSSEFDRIRFNFVCKYVIRFESGEKPTYLKNKSSNPTPHTEKELALMLLRGKEYGSIGFR